MIPETIDRYQIKAELGRGGMATVYRAYDPRFERTVAVKVLPRAFLHEPEFRARFAREAKTIASLEHPAIVPVYDFGEDQEQPYLVMRFMKGGSLTDRLANAPVSVEEAAYILARIGSALDEAHSRGIIHRDLKPANILFDEYGEPYLADFGIVHVSASTAALTASGSLVGTPAYMSPEQVYGDKKLDGRSDVYALGVILFQMLTGSVPYSADTPARLMMKHVMDPVPPVLAQRPDLPPDCDQVIMKAMAKDREERFPSATAMSSALNAATERTSAPDLPKRTTVTPEGAEKDLEATELLDLGDGPGIDSPDMETEILEESSSPLGARRRQLSSAGRGQPEMGIRTRPESKSKLSRWAVITAGLLLVLCVAGGYGIYWLVDNDRIPFLSAGSTETPSPEDTPEAGLVAVATPSPEAALAEASSTPSESVSGPTATPELLSGEDATRESLIATRQALADQAPTPTSASQTSVTGSNTLSPLSGPASGELIPGGGNPVAQSPAGVNVQDFTATARFGVPSAAGRPWDMGLIFRREGEGQSLQLILNSEGSWLLNLRRGDSDQSLETGALGNLLNTSEQGNNLLLLIVQGDRGYFFLNDAFVTVLDLSAVPGAGEIAVATGFMGLAGAPPLSFEEFSVWPLDLAFGPRSNQLDHVADGLPNSRGAGVELANFLADVTFINPYAASFSSWDVAYAFRSTGVDDQYWLILESTGSWSLYDRRSGEDTLLFEGDLDNLDLSEDGRNRLTLLAVNSLGCFLVNGSFVACFELNEQLLAGDVQVATALFLEDEFEGRTTRYQGFSVWSLP